MFELVLKRGGKTHDIQLPAGATILDLKEEIEKVTKVKPEEQKLIGISQPRASAPLDTDKLENFNLKKKQQIMMMQIVDQYRRHPLSPQQATAPPVPVTPGDKILAIQSKLNDLVAQIDTLGAETSNSASEPTDSSEAKKSLKSTLDRHTEWLTQTLISLDAIDAASEREKRREQIKRIHSIQERIDAIKSKL